MTADIINLRQARKQLARSRKEQTATENRAKHGKPKSARLLDEARRVQQSKRLDDHRRPGASGEPKKDEHE